MIKQFAELNSSRALLRAWTGRTIRARYQQSILGWLWAVVQPLASVVIFTIIFTYFVPVDTGDIPYPVFSYVAVVPWAFLSSSLNEMTNSFIGNMSLVTKIYFPREILPLSDMLARLLDFLVGYALLFIMMIIYGVVIDIRLWLFLPLILLIQILLISGIGLLTASLNVFVRDVRSLLILVIQLWFYASPIIYPVSMVPERFRYIYFLNPMAGIIESYRDVLLRSVVPGDYLLISAGISIVMLIIGYWVFNRLQSLFADII